MEATTVIAGLLESIRLATVLVEKTSSGKLTPEQAVAEWMSTSANWVGAVSSWKNTEAPE